MNLDRRIKLLSDVLAVVDFGIASNFIGQNGYFGNSILDFQRLDTCYHGELTGLIRNTDRCFEYEDCSESGRPGYAYFIPDSKLADVLEEKYRPFTIEEWLYRYILGNIVTFRPKNSSKPIHAIFTEWLEHEEVVALGSRVFTFEELFEKYELLDELTGEWTPFGNTEFR